VSRNAHSSDLSEVLTRIKIQVGRLTPQNKDRLSRWSQSIIERSGFPPAQLQELLDSRGGDRQWWLLRQLLPNEALWALDRKLNEVLDSQD
jgi:hypothetical protein